MDIRRHLHPKDGNALFTRLGLAFFLMAVLSTLALDFIDHLNGERTVLFGPGKTAREETVRPAVPAKAAGEAAGRKGEPKAPARQTAQAPAAPQAAPAVEKAAPAKTGERKEAAPAPTPGAPTTAKARPKVALIIDDMGSDRGAIDVVMSLDFPVTMAILPESPYAAEAIRMAGEKNRQYLLHLPLESISNLEEIEGTDGVITTAMTPEEIVSRFREDLSHVPGAAGVNNHMGSRFTSNARLMRILLGAVKDAGLFFIDSRTAADSVAYAEARRMGLATAERDVFLDADQDRSFIPGRLAELLRTARKRGWAVGIGHPFPQTLEVLRTARRLFNEYGVEAVPVSQLVH